MGKHWRVLIRGVMLSGLCSKGATVASMLSIDCKAYRKLLQWSREKLTVAQTRMAAVEVVRNRWMLNMFWRQSQHDWLMDWLGDMTEAAESKITPKCLSEQVKTWRYYQLRLGRLEVEQVWGRKFKSSVLFLLSLRYVRYSSWDVEQAVRRTSLERWLVWVYKAERRPCM